MFAGHYGAGLAIKKLEPELPLGVLFVAVQLPDFLWTVLNLAGVEHTEIVPGITPASPLDFTFYPYSHSLLSAVICSGLAYFVTRYLIRLPGRSRNRSAALIALAVLSHWVLDWLTHRADLPLGFGSGVKTGLGLWYHPVASILVESVVTLGGLALYLSATRGKGFAGRYGMSVLMVVVLLFTISGMLGGTPPPGITIIAATGLVMYILIALLGAWLDKKRVPIK